MQSPLQILFRRMGHSDAIEAKIQKRAQELDKFCNQVLSCRVVIEPAHKHKHKGNLYQVRIDVTVPGKEIVVTREPDEHHAHEDIYVSIRDAFNAMRRQLQDYNNIKRGNVKAHDMAPHGRVTQLMTKDDYGIITTSNGRQIYFHRNSVVNADFDDLKLSDEVRFAEEQGEKGPRASTVYLIGKHHIVG